MFTFTGMKLITTLDVKNEAGHLFGPISNIFHESFKDYLCALDGLNNLGIRSNFKIRTSAGMIHDFIKVRAREKFLSQREVKVGEFNGMFGIIVNSHLFIRFKKLKKNLVASNVQTAQVKQIEKQQLELPGTEGLTVLTAGYIPDLTWTSIANVYLTYRKDGQLIWSKDLHGEITQSAIFISPQESTEEPIVKIKTQHLDTGTEGK